MNRVSVLAAGLKVLVSICMVYLVSEPVPADLISFQYGVNGYTSVVDTTLINHQGDNSGRNPLSIQSGDNEFSTKDSLLLFDQIFGSGPNQILPGSQITSAILEIRTYVTAGSAGGQVNFHRMLMPWDPTHSKNDYGQPPWNDMPWIQPDDFEAVAAFNASFVPSIADTTFQIDVTTDLQAWSDGVPNYGWALLGDPGQDDQASVVSSEGSTVSFRPKLIVGFQPIPEPGSGGVLAIGVLGTIGLFRRRKPVGSNDL